MRTRTATTQTGVLLVPDHQLLDIGKPQWSFVSPENELRSMLTQEGPQDIRLYLAFPGITMREVDFFGLLTFVNRFSEQVNLSVKLIMHARYDGHPAMLASMPHEYVTNIDTHRPAARQLTIRLVTKEVFDFHDRLWRLVLSSLGIHVNLPLRDSHGADLSTLLESGFSHDGGPQRISVMLKGDQAPWYMGRFPAGGSVSP